MERAADKSKGKKYLKRTLQILFFATLTAIGIYYVLKDDPSQTFRYLGGAGFFPLILAILVLLLSIVLDGISLTLLTRIHNPDYHFHQGVINVAGGGLIGCYLKTAAPLLQTYIYHKQGVKPGQAASTLTMNYLIFQFSLVIYIITVFLLGLPQMQNVYLDFLGGLPIIWFALYGLVFQTSFLLIILALALNPSIHRFVINDVVDLLAKIKIIRDPEKTRKKLTLRFVTYRIELKRMFGHKQRVFASLLLSLLKQFLLSIIPFIILWSLNIDIRSVSFLSTFIGAGYVSTIASYLSVGAPEIAFQTIFSQILSSVSPDAATIASATNIIWRSITFYLIFLLGLLTIVLYRGPKEKRTYAFLSDTATIYDLEVIALSENKDDATSEFLSAVQYKSKGEKEHHHRELLTNEELEESFNRIKESVLNQPKEAVQPEVTDAELKSILEERKKDLAKALQESENLLKQKQDPEIEAATEAEFEISAKIQQKSRQKRLAKLEKKKQRRIKQEKRELEEYQPKGTQVSVSDEGIRLDGPEFHQIRTLTSEEPEEKEKKL